MQDNIPNEFAWIHCVIYADIGEFFQELKALVVFSKREFTDET
jgi:hypothetical protein